MHGSVSSTSSAGCSSELVPFNGKDGCLSEVQSGLSSSLWHAGPLQARHLNGNGLGLM